MEQSENSRIIDVFKRYPYWGWLLLSLLLWATTLSKFYVNYKFSKASNLSELISTDLHKKEKALSQFLNDTNFIYKIVDKQFK